MLALSTALLPLYAQENIAMHREYEESWAKTTGMSPAAIHQLWRSTSHFADEDDDDSNIELLDTKTLSNRNQVVLVTAAGWPRCLTLTVFSRATGFLKVWSVDHTPDGRGICDNLGIPARFTVSEPHVELVVPGEPISPHPSHADVEHYSYDWSGRTYLVGRKWPGLEYIPR